jgi:hydrogenase maturation protease
MTNSSGSQPATVVLGLGNPLRFDDAVGLRVAEEVGRLLDERPVPGVRVLTSTRAGLELIDLLSGASRAIIVDCLVPLDPIPGRVRRLSLDDVAGSARLVGAHDVTISGAFKFAEASGLPMPRVVEIYAVDAADTERIEEGLSPAVAAAVPALAREIHTRLLGTSIAQQSGCALCAVTGS